MDRQTSHLKRQFLKRCLFRFVLIAAIYLFAEGIAWLAYRPVTGESISTSGVEPASAEVEAPDVRIGREQAGLGMRDAAMSLHPYFGYVYTPRKPDAKPGPINISEDGFLDSRPAIRKRNSERLLVAIMGGSVAGQLGTWHSELLEQAILSHPDIQQRQIEFVRLGMPGYHQPQQVQQLTYILSQGGEFDVILNVDGFNEIAVPAALNAPRGTHPLFPMNWSMVALDVPDLSLRRDIGAVAYLQEERQRRAERFTTSFWSYSAIARLWWWSQDKQLATRIGHHAMRVQQFRVDEVPFFVHGPARDFEPEGGLVPFCVGVWKRSSLQMQALCQANNIRYLHFLQPNQYLTGSKPLSSEEKRIAYESASPYRPVVEEGYPLLQAAGRELAELGIEFYDLSMLFGETNDTLYVDNCCHFNAQGNELLAAAIAQAIATPKRTDQVSALPHGDALPTTAQAIP